MRLDKIIHTVIAAPCKTVSVTFSNTGDKHDFGDGEEPSISVSVVRDGKQEVRDMPVRLMTEPGFLALCVSELNLQGMMRRDDDHR